MSLIKGETVTVTRTRTKLDELGEPVASASESEVVDGVVVAPGSTADLDATRPEGVRIAYTLCFPKSYAGGLKDAEVTVRGEIYKVVGDPKRYTAEDTPGPWDLTCEVTRTDG